MKIRKITSVLLCLLLCIQPVRAEDIETQEEITETQETTEAAKSYSVTVTNGTASVKSAKAGTKVTVQADSKPGYTFSYWKGAGNLPVDTKKSKITFKMPASDVKLKAVYKMVYGWVKTDKGYKYRKSDGNWIKSTWQKIDGEYYYFRSSGYMQTGWLKLDGKTYYMGRSGARRTGWRKIDGRWYYFRDNGVLLKGWFAVGGSWYYSSSKGVMQTGWMQYKNDWYLLSSSGAMVTGWRTIGSKTFHFDKNGVMAEGWKQISGKWYYFNTDGAMQKGWQKIDGKWYYLGKDGAMRTGWLQQGDTWYYLNKSGSMHTGWLQDNGKWYYMDESGAMVTGMYQVGTKTHKFSSSGVWTGEITIPEISGDYAYVYDLTDDMVLYEKNADTQMYPASLTKIMTVLLALENLDLNRTVTVTEGMLEDLKGQGLSQAGFKAGDTLTVRDLLYGAMLPSGADACNIIAYMVSGNLNDFVSLMNRRAQRLGMTNTNFMNVHGNDHPDHVSTARDVAKLLEAACIHDTFLQVISTYSYTTSNGRLLTSTIWKNTTNYGGQFSIPGLVGGKTGYTPTARYSLAVLTDKDGHKRIFVVAHCSLNYYPSHFRDMSALTKAFN